MEWKEFVRSHTAVRAAEWAQARSRQLIAYIETGCESPIERQLLAAMFCEFDFTEPTTHHYFQGYKGKPIPIEEAGEYASFCADMEFRSYADRVICIFPQVAVGRYRVDFLVVVIAELAPANGDGLYRHELRLAIECDGHDHHDLTKEQAKRDRQRDRWLQASGISILRFTGSEIFNAASTCAEEVHRFIDGWQDKLDG